MLEFHHNVRVEVGQTLATITPDLAVSWVALMSEQTRKNECRVFRKKRKSKRARETQNTHAPEHTRSEPLHPSQMDETRMRPAQTVYFETFK